MATFSSKGPNKVTLEILKV
ncbi:hypothetical protein Patl1_22493 [Pistacia atlantica]|uniref:Uncharacterized protein n=1 Tax=Pistacia atlantica TaxID=434234 RepID=A0ACC0ZUL5_9ROSI|nr:hypothetical protein Patl1_22493 [Pistacia atlantica]